jgi:hypothetical protein
MLRAKNAAMCTRYGNHRCLASGLSSFPILPSDLEAAICSGANRAKNYIIGTALDEALS